jgi:hypothetical protein
VRGAATAALAAARRALPASSEGDKGILSNLLDRAGALPTTAAEVEGWAARFLRAARGGGEGGTDGGGTAASRRLPLLPLTLALAASAEEFARAARQLIESGKGLLDDAKECRAAAGAIAAAAAGAAAARIAGVDADAGACDEFSADFLAVKAQMPKSGALASAVEALLGHAERATPPHAAAQSGTLVCLAALAVAGEEARAFGGASVPLCISTAFVSAVLRRWGSLGAPARVGSSLDESGSPPSQPPALSLRRAVGIIGAATLAAIQRLDEEAEALDRREAALASDDEVREAAFLLGGVAAEDEQARRGGGGAGGEEAFDVAEAMQRFEALAAGGGREDETDSGAAAGAARRAAAATAADGGLVLPPSPLLNETRGKVVQLLLLVARSGAEAARALTPSATGSSSVSRAERASLLGALLAPSPIASTAALGTPPTHFALANCFSRAVLAQPSLAGAPTGAVRAAAALLSRATARAQEHGAALLSALLEAENAEPDATHEDDDGEDAGRGERSDANPRGGAVSAWLASVVSAARVRERLA